MAVLELFIDILAREAGNLALKILATGGVYLGGGIPPRILPQLQQGKFLAAFVSKGRFRDLLETVPVKVICRPDTAILGVAYDGLRMMAG
jgi:glucokinase